MEWFSAKRGAKWTVAGRTVIWGTGLVYNYDDNWCHGVIVDEVGDGDLVREYPVFVDGALRCLPEEFGGPDGFTDLVEAILDPALEEHRTMLDWYGGPFDAMRLDEARSQFGMENLARRRRGPFANHRSGSRHPER